jgi:predicted HTH domain antitoxin
MGHRLEKRIQAALNASGEGLISLGKLAEILGLDPVSSRLYLKDPASRRSRSDSRRSPR